MNFSGSVAELVDRKVLQARSTGRLAVYVGSSPTAASTLRGRSVRIMIIMVPTSLGELVDKITILEIKSERIKDTAKLANIRAELNLLLSILSSATNEHAFSELRARLKSVNEKLWIVEDSLRDYERTKDFGRNFVELARSVYFTNDERANLKKTINVLSGSIVVEEKSYRPYEN